MYIQSCKNDDADFTLCKNFTQTSELMAAVSVLSKVSRVVENRGRGWMNHLPFVLENTTVIIL